MIFDKSHSDAISLLPDDDQPGLTEAREAFIEEQVESIGKLNGLCELEENDVEDQAETMIIELRNIRELLQEIVNWLIYNP